MDHRPSARVLVQALIELKMLFPISQKRPREQGTFTMFAIRVCTRSPHLHVLSPCRAPLYGAHDQDYSYCTTMVHVRLPTNHNKHSYIFLHVKIATQTQAAGKTPLSPLNRTLSLPHASLFFFGSTMHGDRLRFISSHFPYTI